METLIILRSKTDDALEDFVRAQMQLFAKMEETMKVRRTYNLLVSLYESMTKKSSSFLIAHQSEMTKLTNDIEMKAEVLACLKDDEEYLTAACREAESALNTARKTEQAFLVEMLKNEITL